MSLLPLLKSMLHSLDSIESTIIWILRYFSIAVLLLWPFFFVLDVKWIERRQTFGKEIEIGSEMAELQDFSSDSKQQTKAAICQAAVATIHRCLCQGRVQIIHGNLAVESTRLGSSASFVQSTRVQRVQRCNDFGNTQIYKGTSASKVFDVFFDQIFAMLQYSPLLACFVGNLQNFRCRSQQIQQLERFLSIVPASSSDSFNVLSRLKPPSFAFDFSAGSVRCRRTRRLTSTCPTAPRARRCWRSEKRQEKRSKRGEKSPQSFHYKFEIYNNHKGANMFMDWWPTCCQGLDQVLSNILLPLSLSQRISKDGFEFVEKLLYEQHPTPHHRLHFSQESRSFQFHFWRKSRTLQNCFVLILGRSLAHENVNLRQTQRTRTFTQNVVFQACGGKLKGVW